MTSSSSSFAYFGLILPMISILMADEQDAKSKATAVDCLVVQTALISSTRTVSDLTQKQFFINNLSITCGGRSWWNRVSSVETQG